MTVNKGYWLLFLPCLTTSVLTAIFCIRLFLLSDFLKIVGSVIFGMAVSSLISLMQSLFSDKSENIVYKWAFSGLIGGVTGLISSSYSILGVINSQGQSIFLVFLIMCSFETMGGATSFGVSKLISEKVNK